MSLGLHTPHNILKPTTRVTFFNSGFKNDPTELFPSIVLVIAVERRFHPPNFNLKIVRIQRGGGSWALLRRVCWPTLEECYASTTWIDGFWLTRRHFVAYEWQWTGLLTKGDGFSSIDFWSSSLGQFCTTCNWKIILGGLFLYVNMNFAK
jgi:hypothetical protein